MEAETKISKIPMSLKLKREVHKQIAYAQDLVVEDLYRFFPKAIIHGGTAIWRCYSGNRFSEDIDVYIKKDVEKINELFENLKRKGFTILKLRAKENSLYSVIKFGRVEVRLEAIFKIKKFILKEYETADGAFINVYTLKPEDLASEKIKTYLKRKKIRDLYDIFFLLRHVKEKSIIKKDLKKLIRNFEKPHDEPLLKILIIIGISPSSKEMVAYIEKWVK